eukprot:TRINITY_DN8228_c0_g1_i1.p1 TRINITY_DN8228_c0_g1~~TRINITY_DN8228_c0_g1_i1.p1  ORF type:complete len:246 (+),score=30.74 TRINITY_DN8228_c0_g1_i1:55-738(+)
MTRLWDTAPRPDKSVLATSTYLVPSNGTAVAEMPSWTWNHSMTFPFTTRVSMVRLLGGWPHTNHSYTVGDLASRADNGSIVYHPDQLLQRLNAVLGNGLTPLVVLDNVPWCFTAMNASTGTYGNVHGPTSQEDYKAFLVAMLTTLKQSYPTRANEWEYRIGTELNCLCHWQDCVNAWKAWYTTSYAAVKQVFPSAAVGPGNICNYLYGGVCVLLAYVYHPESAHCCA